MADISVIIPVFNGAKWIDQCMDSIARQFAFIFVSTGRKFEIVTYNDGSTDCTQDILEKWAKYFTKRKIAFIIVNSNVSKGVGAAKNGAVQKSSGRYLCFQDIDDIMHPYRIFSQWKAAEQNHNCLVGSKVTRNPPNSTPRYINWANNLTLEQMQKQIYTSNGPTLLMPTWFCHRSVYDKVGGFVETGHGTPEDLIFFYEHIDKGGELYRVNEELLIYTYHEGATTFSISRKSIWDIQLKRLATYVLSKWNQFTIWNAGKLGRKVVRSLFSLPNIINKVTAFCDVDKNKIGRTVELYCPIKRIVLARVPVISYTEAKPPLLICVKLGLTNGDFERRLSSLNLIEDEDYVLFC